MMFNSTVVLLLGLLVAAQAATAAEVTIVATDADGAAGRVGAPVWVDVDLEKLLGEGVSPERLRLLETTRAAAGRDRTVPVQFEPAAGRPSRGTLWWLMPPGPKGERRFQLAVAAKAAPAALSARYDKERGLVDVTEGHLPVLRYNHATVPPPPRIVNRFERGRKQPRYYARGDYIHPLFGPDGEEITDDYSLNHPHHRGVSWSWPVVRWKGEVRDLWAVRGIWARPVAMRRVVAGDVLTVIEAESVWKWADKHPVVREEVVIRAFRQSSRCRFVDVEVRLAALSDGVAIGGRPKAGYGGFGLRTFPTFKKRQIAMHIDPPQSRPRRAWLHLTGVFPAGKGPAGMAMFEHVTNPGYPNYPNPKGLDHVPERYPPWRCVLPCFPGDREVALPMGKTLVLKHRLWIHPGSANERTLADAWAAYAKPPKATVAKGANPHVRVE